MVISRPSDFETYLFHEGQLFHSYQAFGAHVRKEQGIEGVRFTVWAPHARQVNVIGDFNQWVGDEYPLTRINNEGIWSGFFPFIQQGTIYKYEILTKDYRILRKSDPYAFYSELRPNTASIVYDLSGYQWNDDSWQKKKREKRPIEEPMFIYEVHLGTWRKKPNGELYTYSELANELVEYVVEQGYTHIELLPVVEHPFDRSWGYQGTGYYSLTSRYGTPEDFMKFVDICHQHDIGVILDWVPGHFCKDEHGLYLFDGEPTFEYSNPFVMQNDVWGTANFDLGRTEVRSYLISNAIFWMDRYHIDGFRVDAVANMLYWDMEGKGQVHENPYAVDFIKILNEEVVKFDPSVLMIAEDSTEWPLVTSSTEHGGLGFTFKWNMGWMNDVLKYMEMDPIYRRHHHNLLTFSLLYAHSERFILPFSHDEVVHGKKSLLNKMPGDYWQKFAQLRLLYGYMIAHPGKKLVFMGGEFGQFAEWKDLEQLDWHLLNYDMHSKMLAYTKTLLNFYKSEPSLWELDYTWDGFQWIDADNNHQSIFSFIRKSKDFDEQLLVICNFLPTVYHQFNIGVPVAGTYHEVFSSDQIEFGGSGQVNSQGLKSVECPFHGQPYRISMTVPPYGVSILKPSVEKRKEREINYASKEMYSNASSRRARKQITLINEESS